MKLLVEVTQEEAEEIKRALTYLGGVSQRIIDRFDIASTADSGDPVTLIGTAVVISRAQDPVNERRSP